jgi:hypothetical protein
VRDHMYDSTDMIVAHQHETGSVRFYRDDFETMSQLTVGTHDEAKTKYYCPSCASQLQYPMAATPSFSDSVMCSLNVPVVTVVPWNNGPLLYCLIGQSNQRYFDHYVQELYELKDWNNTLQFTPSYYSGVPISTPSLIAFQPMQKTTATLNIMSVQPFTVITPSLAVSSLTVMNFTGCYSCMGGAIASVQIQGNGLAMEKVEVRGLCTAIFSKFLVDTSVGILQIPLHCTTNSPDIKICIREICSPEAYGTLSGPSFQRQFDDLDLNFQTGLNRISEIFGLNFSFWFYYVEIIVGIVLVIFGFNLTLGSLIGVISTVKTKIPKLQS